MEKRESNYEIMKHQMQTKFAAYNMDEVARIWGLEQQEGLLLVTLVGRQYRIDRATGMVLVERDGRLQEADFNVSMTLFDMLTRPRCRAAGEVVSIGALTAAHSTSTLAGGFFSRAGRHFEHRCAALSAACERLGGIRYGKGDVGYLLPIFRDLHVAVQFWDSDEEFGPELRILCDKHMLSFMHFETLMYLLGHVLNRLREEAGDTTAER